MPTRSSISMTRFLASVLVELEMDLQGLGELVSDGVHGGERAHRLLEDHRDLVAPDVADLAAGGLHPGDVDDAPVLAAEADLALDDPAGPVDELKDGAGGDRLAAAALAHQAQRLALPQRQVDPVDGLDHALVGVEPGLEAPDLQQDVVRGSAHSGAPSCRGPRRPAARLRESSATARRSGPGPRGRTAATGRSPRCGCSAPP